MPGTATISSGYTSNLQSKAIRSDQARILARLQNIKPASCNFITPTIQNSKCQPSGILELNAQKGCALPTDVLSQPKTAMTSTAYTLSIQNATILQSRTDRFAQYSRVFPAPCPPPTVTNAGVGHAPILCSYSSSQNNI